MNVTITYTSICQLFVPLLHISYQHDQPWSESLTHGRGEYNDPQHVHAFAGPGRRLHYDVRRRRKVQGEVPHVCAVVVLDAVDEKTTCRGLVHELRHRRFRNQLRDSLRAILLKTKKRKELGFVKSCESAVAVNDAADSLTKLKMLLFLIYLYII